MAIAGEADAKKTGYACEGEAVSCPLEDAGKGEARSGIQAALRQQPHKYADAASSRPPNPGGKAEVR
ncbi:hypothetical protein NL676_029623 [Syzygium grande]|nr:hypothetical protein NL676_029623 [Syzygium grande]